MNINFPQQFNQNLDDVKVCGNRPCNDCPWILNSPTKLVFEGGRAPMNAEEWHQFASIYTQRCHKTRDKPEGERTLCAGFVYFLFTYAKDVYKKLKDSGVKGVNAEKFNMRGRWIRTLKQMSLESCFNKINPTSPEVENFIAKKKKKLEAAQRQQFNLKMFFASRKKKLT